MADLFELQKHRCKTCGEPLDLSKAQGGVIKCAVCDSCFTLPKADASQKVLDFLSQGEHDLDTGRFEDAYTAFAKAAEYDSNEPEAYWGMALADFKIQYLKDEVNNRLQPICHEISDKDFTNNSNFLKALKCATEAQKVEYQRKAQEINYRKNEFYKIAKTGVNYDCFICAKVTDEIGHKTIDSERANDIYFELKGKGYKPFFSERELVGVTGADYEARILYALKSSECMLVVCFDEAYLRTKWVKNEYTRFLKLVNDEEKESDSIALVFGDRPVEKLPGKKGKIQGIALNSLTAMERIVSFVDSHTPEARKRREEEVTRKVQEDEAQRKKFAEQEKRLRQLEQILKAQQNATASQPDLSQQVMLETPLSEFEVEDGALLAFVGTETEVIIPNGIESIGDGAFEDCVNITSIKISDSVTTIGDGAFYYCIALKNITIGKSVTNIGDEAFGECSGIESITVDADNPCYKSINNCLLTKDGKTLILGCKNSIIPESVTSIGDFAFMCSQGLTNLTISHNVKRIGDGAFLGCSGLESVNISNGVTSIGSCAFVVEDKFDNCKLKKVIIPKSVKKMGHGVFPCKDDFIIFCRAQKQPKGWDKDWDRKEVFGDRHKVVWGYKGE